MIFRTKTLETLGLCAILVAKLSQNLRVGKNCRVLGFPIISVYPGSLVEAGARLVLISNSRLTALGVSRPVIIRTLSADAVVKIGDDVGMSGTVICAASKVSIGNRCLIGSGTMIFDSDFHPVDYINRRYAPMPLSNAKDSIDIADDVFIGANVLILKGVSVGEGSVIAAGSVVTSDVPPRTIVGGNPARFIRTVRG